MKNKRIISAFSALIFLTAHVFGQTGGNFAIEKSVVAGGGGQNAAGGNFALDGTIGQSAAGNALNNAPFTVTSGFWNFSPLAPSAANAAISGKILTADGAGIRSVSVSLINVSGGEIRAARSGGFGYYRFENVPVGETYILTVRSNRFAFEPETRIITLLNELTEIDFTALPQ